MSKVKLIYKKREFDVERISDRPLNFAYSKITDMAIPVELYLKEIEVVKFKKTSYDETILILRSKDKKKFLKCNVMAILDMKFSGQIEIISLK